jgi:REP element-mobilizing transposase RayT
MSNARYEFQENNYYHVYNRWYQKQTIFKSDDDFKRFYDYITKNHKLFPEIQIVSYVFIPNHFHFIFRSLETGLKISDFMRRIQVSYAMYFKRKYETGLNQVTPVFEWRFKAKHIDSEEYLAQCIAYVNYNPLRHDIVQDIAEYRWTSYHQLKDHKKIVSYKDMILSELEY